LWILELFTGATEEGSAIVGVGDGGLESRDVVLSGAAVAAVFTAGIGGGGILVISGEVTAFGGLGCTGILIASMSMYSEGDGPTRVLF
jgi:hypothetical protein